MKNIFPQNVFVVESEFEENDEERLKMFRDLESRIPNLPVKSWLTMKNLTKSKKSGCSIYPSILDIEYQNKYWQLFRFQNSTFHLYAKIQIHCQH